MHRSTHGNNDGHHWYADFIILCFLMTHFKALSQAHTIVYLKKYNSKIPTFTPSLLNQIIESLNTICRLQENKMLQKNGHHWSPASIHIIANIYVSYDVAVIQWITSCHKNRMTTRVITLWRVDETSLTTSVSTMHFLLEILSIFKAIESSFKGSYDKQNLTLVVISYEIYETSRRRLVS